MLRGLSLRGFFLFHQAGFLVPGEGLVVGVELGSERIGDIDRKTAATLQQQVEKCRRFRVVRDTGFEGGPETGGLGLRDIQVVDQILQVVIKAQIAAVIIIPLDASGQFDVQVLPVSADNGGEGIRKRIQLRAVHQGDGAGPGSPGLFIVIRIVILAKLQQVRLFSAEELGGQVRIPHAGGKNLGGGEYQVVAGVFQFISDFHATGQAVVEDDVFHLHRQRIGKIAQLDPLGMRPGIEVLIADRLGFRPGILRLPRFGTDAGLFAAAGVIARNPAGPVGGNEQPVPAGGEFRPDIFEDSAERFLGSADGNVVIHLQRVRDGQAVLAPVDPHQAGRILLDIIPANGRVVAEGQDGLVLGQPGENIRLQLPQVAFEHSAQVVISQTTVDENMVVGAFEGLVDPPASRDQQDAQEEGKCFDLTHSVQI